MAVSWCEGLKTCLSHKAEWQGSAVRIRQAGVSLTERKESTNKTVIKHEAVVEHETYITLNIHT